jgi:hypothetical protein
MSAIILITVSLCAIAWILDKGICALLARC